MIGQKINEAVDSIAVDRELDMEDEDTIVEKKKIELKNWLVHNYAHELNQRASNGGTMGDGTLEPIGQGESNAVENDLSFNNLVSIAKEIDSKTS